MRLEEKIRNNFSNEGDKLRILRSNNFFVQEGIESALLLNDGAHINNAFRFAEQNKSVLLSDAVKGNRARSLGDLPDSLVQKEIRFQEKMGELKKQLTDTKTQEEKDSIYNSMSQLNLEIDRFLISLKKKYPKYHALKYENITANAKDIQNLLDDKSLLLEYFISDSMLYLFAVSNKEVQLFPIKVKNEVLKNKVRRLRNSLSNYKIIINHPEKSYYNYTENAFWFYEKILKVALKDKKIENLIVIADGELGHLPFGAFLSQKAKEIDDENQGEAAINSFRELDYLIKDYNISYNYSATLWKNNLQRKNNGNNRKMLACAASYTPCDSSLLKLRLPYYFKLRTQLQPLPATNDEVLTLKESFQGDFLTDESANERSFKEIAPNYSVIHLAMHGLLDRKIPMLSSLVFSENLDSTEDNFLQAYEISKLKLNADLVVLSACETGYGKFEQGEGIISLARSFMYAGVPSLVVSLWQVNDASTAEVMKLLYENIELGMNKDAALRQAKLSYIVKSHGIMCHPAFWSPFIQLGDNSPINPENKYEAIIKMSGITLFLLLIIGVIYRKNKKSTESV